MTIPRLKRIKVASVAELQSWLAKHSGPSPDVMIVTCNATSPTKHVSSAQVREAVAATGWTTHRSYALDGNLVGHVLHQG